MFITNGKVFTTRDQNDLETLKKFAQNLFEAFAENAGIEVEDPNDYYEERERYSCYKIPQGMSLQFLLDQGADYVAIEEDDLIEKIGNKQLITYKYQFNPEEITMNADQLARYVIEQSEIKSEAKEVQSMYKARLDEKSSQVQKLSLFVANGYEMRDEECRVFLNYKEKTKQFISVKTGKLIRSEAMNNEDFQLFIQFPEIGQTA